MIIIIDTEDPHGYVDFSRDNKHVILDGDFHVVARFDVVDRDDDGEPNVIRELPHDWRPEVTI